MIAGIIKREIEENKFTFIGFYERRVRRIFPALFGVLFFSIILGFLFLLPSDFKVQEARHACAKVKSWDSEVRFAESLTADSHIIVDKSMVEDVIVNGKTINLILDNYVLGLITQ